MSSVNHIKIEVVTLLVLYFLSSDVTILITDTGEKWSCKTLKKCYFLNLLA